MEQDTVDKNELKEIEEIYKKFSSDMRNLTAEQRELLKQALQLYTSAKLGKLTSEKKE